MSEKEINIVLKKFNDSLLKSLPNLENKIRDIYIDLWEIYKDFVFEDDDVKTKKISYPDEIIFDNVLSLLKIIVDNSNNQRIGKVKTCLINLEIKLEHSQNHLKEARNSLKSIIKSIEKMIPDEVD